jgi:hypothetical protein
MTKIDITNVTVTDDNKDLVAFAQTIDFEPLFAHVRTFLYGASIEFNTPELKEDRDGILRVVISSQSVLLHAGIFAAILEKCEICQFGSKVYTDKDGTNRLWVDIHVDYEHKGGGMNGMAIASARYTEAKGWDIRNVGN